MKHFPVVIFVACLVFSVSCPFHSKCESDVVLNRSQVLIGNNLDEISFLEPYIPEPTWLVRYLHEIEPILINADGDNKPYIMMAGYWDTDISYEYGGTFTMLAYVWDADGDVENVEIYWEGEPTGAFLKDDGRNGDFSPGDGIWGIQFSIPPKIVPSGEYLFELRAEDADGNFSDLWPYLTIHG